MPSAHDETSLSEPWTMAFPYTRTPGPVIGRFLAGLRDKQVWGLRTRAGRVVVPPTGYDPITSEAMDEWVEVEAAGELVGFTWVPAPLATHPSAAPFAWALVKLDGADTALLHVLRVDDPACLRRGLRVRVAWASERQGHIRDIEGFVVEALDDQG